MIDPLQQLDQVTPDDDCTAAEAISEAQARVEKKTMQRITTEDVNGHLGALTRLHDERVPQLHPQPAGVEGAQQPFDQPALDGRGGRGR